MTNYDIKRLALVLSVQAQIEGMKAENENCKLDNATMAFSKEQFDDKASELMNFAYAQDEQL